MSEMFHSLIPIISQITYKNDFNRNSFFLPSAGEALADIYDRHSPVLRFGDGLPMRQNLTEKI